MLANTDVKSGQLDFNSGMYLEPNEKEDINPISSLICQKNDLLTFYNELYIKNIDNAQDYILSVLLRVEAESDGNNDIVYVFLPLYMETGTLRSCE